MKTTKAVIQSAVTALALAASAFGAEPMGTAFTYHGRLTQSACGQSTLNGLYGLRVRLYDALADGAQQGPELTRTVPVTNGLFVTSLDFGADVFAGDARWLELEVRTNNPAEPFVLLSPRQELKPTPYAFYADAAKTAEAAEVAGSVPWGGIPDVPPDLADGDDDTTYSSGPGLILAGTVFRADFAGSGVADKVARSDHNHAGAYEPAGTLHDGLYWKLLGNGGTDPMLNFLGTTDDHPLNLRANDRRVLRLEFPGPSPSPNLIGGHGVNGTAPGVSGATISGGGLVGSPNVVDANWGTIGGGSANWVQGESEHGTVGGGSWNVISSNSPQATIGGGNANFIDRGSSFATIDGGHANGLHEASVASAIGGGISNLIRGSLSATIGGGQNNDVKEGTHATVGGGVLNRIELGMGCTIGGGQDNQINWPYPWATPVEHATIGGGIGNLIGSDADSATIAGGAQNDIQDRSPFATVGGGVSNVIETNVPWATITGGQGNRIYPHADAAVIGGGHKNLIQDSATNATVAGGIENRVGGSVYAGTIGGGSGNLLEYRAACATVAGGSENDIGAFASSAAIGGGASNSIAPRAVGAVIAGGSQNTNAGVRYDVSNHLAHATIGGGLRNTISTNSPFATIAGGHNNLIRTNASDTTISGGQYNVIERGTSSGSIGGGYANHLYPGASLSTVAGGQGNIIQTNGGSISGGAWNRIETNAQYATIPGGKEAVARNYGQLAYASGGFTSYPGGDAQTSVHVLRNTQTTGACELFLDGYNKRMTVPPNSTWTFDILIVARSRTGVSAGWQIRGVVENDGGGAAFVGTPKTDLLGLEPAPWAATVNVVGDALVVTTLAFSDRPVRWVATVRTAETTYAP